MSSLSTPAKIVAFGIQLTVLGAFLAAFGGPPAVASFPLAVFGTVVVLYGLFL
ncbi:hypothetical protein [Haloarchaeobius amylolyticus]|uniref:hypothetical protein n=1 Tax=Haloarchaeobius amylolyticus TaxID=1198296 RepID=UPI00226D7856|nr:hypothetical protein [Haloarchaeobius amylolyticus]